MVWQQAGTTIIGRDSTKDICNCTFLCRIQNAELGHDDREMGEGPFLKFEVLPEAPDCF
jgi:hypothetical protein